MKCRVRRKKSIPVIIQQSVADSMRQYATTKEHGARSYLVLLVLNENMSYLRVGKQAKSKEIWKSEKLPSLSSVLEKSPRRERGRGGAPFPSVLKIFDKFNLGGRGYGG